MAKKASLQYNQKMMFNFFEKKIFILIFFLAVFFGLVAFFPPVLREQKTVKYATVVFKNTTVKAETADTEAKRRQGLSGRKNLANGEGIWFVFFRETDAGIWMKEMNFPIDIVWFDRNFKITHIKENAAPESYPEVFAPSTPSRFVLEVPAGFVQKYGVSLGDVVSVLE